MWPSFIAMAGTVSLVLVSILEYRRTRLVRQNLLDSCIEVFPGAVKHFGEDGFPRLGGYWKGRYVQAELIPDSMTLRRLPQLWLRLTRVDVQPGLPGFSLLARPTGAEFYSLTWQFSYVLEPPSGLEQPVIARGTGPEAQRLINELSPVLRQIFAEARVKEVAVTAKGLRLIWQAAEGRRGMHLLLRQAEFGAQPMKARDLTARLDDLDRLSGAINLAGNARAA